MAAESFTADRNLYHTKDRSRIVEEGDPAALLLAYVPGDMIDADTAKRHKLAPKKQPESEPLAESKQAASAPEGKATSKATADKGA